MIRADLIPDYDPKRVLNPFGVVKKHYRLQIYHEKN